MWIPVFLVGMSLPLWVNCFVPMPDNRRTVAIQAFLLLFGSLTGAFIGLAF